MNIHEPSPHSDCRERFEQTLAMWKDRKLSDKSKLDGELILALGRCRLFGIEVADDLFDQGLYEKSIDSLTELAAEQADRASKLDAWWQEIDDPWEADSLCLGLVEARSDFWGVELVLKEKLDTIPQTLMSMIDRFDHELEKTLPTLSSIAIASEYKRFRDAIVLDRPLPWWVGDSMDSASETMAAATELAVSSVANVRLASRDRFQDKDLSNSWSGRLAGSTEELANVTKKTLCWRSPIDINLRAELRVPKVASKGDEAKPRKLKFKHASGNHPGLLSLKGLTIRIGQASPKINDDLFAEVALADLRGDCEGYLWVDGSPIPWLLDENEE